jgi:hypothetical protein
MKVSSIGDMASDTTLTLANMKKAEINVEIRLTYLCAP